MITYRLNQFPPEFGLMGVERTLIYRLLEAGFKVKFLYEAGVIAEKYAIDILNAGIFAGEGCQGFGLQKTYSLCNSTREKFEANEGVGWGCHSPPGTQVFISETAIEGFPKPYHYKREWGIK